ncbi:hydroxymethylglutaryl-CoA lyase [Nakamurella sp. DB0629]|uniref:Hydroxymethylglutaryl-CoA lyase n=2 Tax=Nakamurella aerolata TaxID=1656892 RepID=A0A849A651_9ACTN|nr:hydroxymethylglutaryl-CoA lyase [Nakamurella aerolata]NNG36039.1 hydroxymethylglutaryl-CoA lyase [Nakamurella aerolata]
MSRPSGLPMVVRDPALPTSVQIVEVGPRDGLQNEATTIAPDVKLEFIDRLGAAGLRVVEATSFVNPRWVPQLADAAEVFPAIRQRPGVRYPVLVPNERGLDGAMSAGANEIAVFASATDTFARRNLASTLDGQFEMFAPVVRRARAEGLRVRGYLSMCYGDPWEGAVPPDQVVAAGRRLFDLGVDELSLGDTIGVATAAQVTALLELFGRNGFGPERLAVHFHDTYGQALANTLSAMRSGVRIVDASAGGLGGCPFAGSATGNLATEDLVWMLDGLGIEHGIDLSRLVQTSSWMADHLGRPSPSAVVRALAGSAGADRSEPAKGQ